MECKVDTLMKEAISLPGRSESIFRITSITMYQLPPKPSRQEAFESLVMNFILDQEKRIKQLEEYISVIGGDFLQLSLEVIVKLKEEIRLKKYRIEKITRELVHEFFASFEFKNYASKGNPNFKGVSFRMGGEYRTMSLLDLGWRVGLYYDGDSLDDHTRLSMQHALTVKTENDWRRFWPNIRDEVFVVGSTSITKIKDLKVRLAHHCILITILGHKESAQRIIAIDMFYLYCIYVEGVICHIPYWLALNLMRARDMNVLCGGMFMTRIAWLFREYDEIEEEAEDHVEAYRDMSQRDYKGRQERWMDQQAIDNGLVLPEMRLMIKRCNARITFNKPQREEMYKVTLEALKLSP
uniref:Uncharacterized protein n=1 Tax=Tanacetum cinerariifolium TaxID=118510 RepID=A0A699GM04_TANCI|nr:hypothetical protein [Tanacetum cinerariifolium]